MFLFVALIFVTHALQIIALSDSENNLLKYRTDLDQIGSDVENFIYDFTKDIVKNAATFIDNDYNSAYEGDEEEESESVQNEIKKEKIKFTTTPATVTDIEDANNGRRKRSISEENILTTVGKPDFKERTESTVPEDQSLQEIKDELEKLTELTILLKDQQKILSVLSKEGTNNLSEEYDSQDLIEMLQNLEKDGKKIKPKVERQENINKLKTEIQKTISSHNETTDEWKGEKGIEIKLVNQIKQQKDDINALKTVVEQLLNQKNATNEGNNVFNKSLHHDEQGKDVKTNDEFVGLPLFLPKSLPKLKEHLGPKIENKKYKKANKDDNFAEERSIIQNNIKSNNQSSEKLKEQIQKEKITGNDMPIKNKVFNKTEETEHPEARASSVEKDISKLFDVIEDPHKAKLEDKIKELEEQLNKDSKEKALKKELSILRNLLNDEKQDKPSSKSLLEDDDDNNDDEDIQFLKRLKIVIKAINKESNKIEQKPETDIDARLKELQMAIDRLKPKEEITNPVRIDDIQHKGLSSEPKVENQSEQPTVEQLKRLRSKIDELLLKEESHNDQIKPPITTGMSNQPQMYPNLDLKRGLLPYPLWYRGNSYSEPMAPPFFDYSSQLNTPYYYLPHSQLPEPASREIITNGGTKFLEPLGTDIRSQFFPAPQLFPAPPLFPARSFGDFDYNQEDPAGFVLPQPGHYQTEVNNHDLKKITNVNDLKSEIYNLEGILSKMNTSPYNEKVGNKEELKQLGQEVEGLKVIISSLGEDTTVYPVNPQPSITKANNYSTRHKRSTESPSTTTDNKVVPESPANTQAYDDVTSKLRQYFLEEENKERTAHYNELKNRLNRIKSQLEKESSYSQNQMEYWPFQQYQETPNKYPTYTHTIPPHLNLATVPHEDVSTTIIARIVEKIIAALPKIIGKLFGVGVQKMIDNVDKTYGNEQGNSYGYNYGVSNNNNDLQSIFHKLGIFGYIPIILLNIISAITKMCKSLKKNKLFANFIVPGLVVLLVSGAVVFLIWWLQPEENSIFINQIETDKLAGNSGNYLYDNYGRYAGTNYNDYRSSYIPYQVYDFNRTPWYNNNYLRNFRNFNGRAINRLNGVSSAEGFPMVYYRSYFDDGSKRV